MIKKVKIPQLQESDFLIIPKPLPNELFSSWFVRMAYAHKTHPHTFEHLYLNLPQNLFSKNIDVALDVDTMSIISKKCKHEIDIQSLTLQTYDTYLQEKIIPNGLNKFITPLRYCPTCLKKDKIPYFRKEWKVTLCTICQEHRCFLYDACPQCNTKLNISQMYRNIHPYTFCCKCGYDLARAKTQHIHYSYQHIFQYTKILFEILGKGYVQLGSTPIYSFYFFDVLTQLSKIILKHGKFKFLEEFIPISTLRSWKNMKLKNAAPVYTQISIKDQFMLFGSIVAIFLNYPHNIRDYIAANELTHWQTTRDMTYLPFWFETLINDISPHYVPYSKIVTDGEIKACKKYLLSKGEIINKANLTKFLGCNFFSSYSKLGSKVYKN